MKISLNILLFIILTSFLLNGRAIYRVLSEKPVSVKLISTDQENESENEQFDSEDELASHFQDNIIDSYSLGLLKSNYVSFCFQFSYYKKVHRDFISPPPDLG